MIGLTLAGGGVRGSYQVGAYMAFRKCHIKFDGFVGTSIGSFNAAMLAAGREKELLTFWQNINVGKVVGFNEKYIAKLQELHKESNVLEHVVNNFKDFIVNKGFSSAGLKEVLENEKLEDEIRKNHKDFGLITVRAKDFTPIYKFIEDIPEGKLNDYILASCYLPVFQKIKLIDEEYYMDGGFYDNAPANMLLEKGYNKVYVVDLSAIGIKRKLIDKSRVVVLKPSRNLKSILNTNLDDIKYNIKLGYYDTIKKIKNLDGYKFIFKKHNGLLYEVLKRNVNKNLLENVEHRFKTFNAKKLIIKSIEYIFEKENKEYTKIYDPLVAIKEIKKMTKKNYVYEFIDQLKIF